MFKTITLMLADGGSRAIDFRASGTTSIRFRQVFHTELLRSITALIDAAGEGPLSALMRASQTAQAAGLEELTPESLDPESLKAVFAIAGSGEMESIGKMAYIMNKSAERVDASTLNVENYYEWVDQFESMEFITHAMDFIGLYLGNRETTSEPKKDTAQLTET